MTEVTISTTPSSVALSSPTSKVTQAHLKRDAFLYVRQSTLQQVVKNTESTQRQYALRQRAVILGWTHEQVHVIDCDLGQSGASTVDRIGFQELVTEVSLGHAGIVLGLEVSRLARNSADWHRLLELCALWDTLILDEDGLYDCNDFNDRILLGLKGAMSEAELHFLRARMRGGILSKARRGELPCPLPIGFVYDDRKHVQLDPDKQVQDAISLLFSTYRRMGSALATVKYFADKELLFPRRVRTGLRKGELMWGQLGHPRVLQLLHNPRYAGAFFFGRTKTHAGGSNGKTQSAPNRDRSTWVALLPGAHPGYITWEEFEDNQRRLLESAQSYNPIDRKHPPGEGPALLQGLLICGVCGRHMTVRYHERKGQLYPDYICQHERVQHSASICQHIHGVAVDAAIEKLVVDLMTLVSVELALAVQQEVLSRQQEALQLRNKQVERAQYEVDLTRQRYLRVDPNNRLVAGSLEADWNDALRKLETAQSEFEQQRKHDVESLDDEMRSRVLKLATDFPAVWHDPKTSSRDRKRMLRLLIEDILLLKTPEHVSLQIRMRGGQTQTLLLPPLQLSWQSWVTRPEVIAEIDQLLADHTDQQVADLLNAKGMKSGRSAPFNVRVIGRLRRVYKLKSYYDRLRERGLLTAGEMAERLKVSKVCVRKWASAGLLRAYPHNAKPEFLYEWPAEDIVPSKHLGKKLRDRSRFPKTHAELFDGGAS